MATDSSGAVVWAASYLPFGGIDLVWADTGVLEQNLRFPGQWFQAETGLHQNWMRDYDPTTGRYLQADPLGLVDGPNVYGYARQSPVRLTDPTGLLTILVGGVFDASRTQQVQRQLKNIHDPNKYYFTHDQLGQIIELITRTAEENPCEPIILIGHSFGGNTAAKAAKKTRLVNLLITADAVSGWSTPLPSGIADVWVDIYTSPKSYGFSDFVADLGSGGAANRRNRYGNADQSISVPNNHYDFGGILDAAGYGIENF